MIYNTIIGTTVLNSAGLTETKTDKGGTISYVYNAEKKPISATTNSEQPYLHTTFTVIRQVLQSPMQAQSHITIIPTDCSNRKRMHEVKI